jgi:chloride channel protein, CIC family
MQLQAQAREIARVPLSLITRLRLVLFGHEDLAGIVFWAALVGICGALASVAFREGIRLFELAFTGQAMGLVNGASRLVWWHRAIVPVIGGVLSGWVLYILGSRFVSLKVVDYMEAVLVGDGRISLRGTLLRSVSSLLTIASGGSIGREGSMVQLSAMIGSRIGRLARAPVPRLRLLVACGGAAGIAAAYNAPISGSLFVSEIVLGSLSMETFGPLVVASVMSDATIHRFLGYGPLFTVPHVEFASNWELGFYIVLGVLLGHLAPPFLGLLDFTKGRFVRLGLPLYWQLGLGGLIVGAISVFVPQVWGNGYSVIGAILTGELLGWWLLVILAAKVLATSATVGSGAAGGVLTPTLFIGCAVGALVGGVLHHLMPTVVSVPAAYALIGMGGFLSATTLAPLTSILMIFEMTGDYEIVLPLMLACVTAHYTAKVYRNGRSVYHASLHAAAAVEGGDDWRLRTVEMLIKPAVAVVQDTTTIGAMLERLPKRPIDRVFVVQGQDLIAWLDPRELLKRMQEARLDGTLPVAAVAKPVEFALAPDMPLTSALEAFLREQATVLPVTPGQWRNTLLGQVSRSDVLLAIQDRLTYPK